MLAAAVLAGFMGLQPPLPVPTERPSDGNWIVIAVSRVIAPDQHPGECFVQARIETVLRGRAFRAGEAVGLSLRCRSAGIDRAAAASQPVTIQMLRSQKRALAHVDAGGRVLENAYYGLGGSEPSRPAV